MNPVAVCLWLFGGLVGYLVGDVRGALIGVAAALGLSLFCTIINTLTMRTGK